MGVNTRYPSKHWIGLKELNSVHSAGDKRQPIGVGNVKCICA